MQRVAKIVAPLAIGGLVFAGAYAWGHSSAADADDASRAEQSAYENGVASARSSARAEAATRGALAGRKVGTVAGVANGSKDGEDDGSSAANDELAARAEQAAAAAEAAIPERCRGIPVNTTAYHMCIHAPGFPDSIPP